MGDRTNQFSDRYCFFPNCLPFFCKLFCCPPINVWYIWRLVLKTSTADYYIKRRGDKCRYNGRLMCRLWSELSMFWQSAKTGAADPGGFKPWCSDRIRIRPHLKPRIRTAALGTIYFLGYHWRTTKQLIRQEYFQNVISSFTKPLLAWQSILENLWRLQRKTYITTPC